MQRTLYSLIGYLLLPIMVLRLLLKSLKTPVYRHKIKQRLGFIGQISSPTIWVHCVSVGEFRAAIILIDQLAKHYPKYQILITTTTPTGNQAVQNHYKNKFLHCYFPFDLPLIVEHYISQINLKICILLETEIWANLIHTLYKKNIPTFLVNARLSQRSFTKYQKFAPKLTQQTLNKLSLIATQNHNSLKHFIALGANKNKVINTGNIKFDQNIKVNKTTSKTLKTMIGNRKVVVFASTHRDEEKQIIRAYLSQKPRIDALLVIVPRHPQRFGEVYKLAQKHAINIEKRSTNKIVKNCTILLGDSMGEMMAYFDIADIVFMGGSLSNNGGHNVLEPAALSKPILFGENMFNFIEISKDLLNHQAAIQVGGASALFAEISTLLNNKQKAQTLGKNANRYFQSKQGAVNSLIKQIGVFL